MIGTMARGMLCWFVKAVTAMQHFEVTSFSEFELIL